MAIDWRDLRRELVVTAQMVSPSNPNEVYGEISGVDLSGSSVSAAYYTDTRTSGRLSVVGGGYTRRGAYVRLTCQAPSIGHTRVLGTYLVTKDDAKRANGEWTYDLTLQSVLYGLSQELCVAPWSLSKGASAVSAMKTLVHNAGGGKVACVDLGTKAYKLSQPLVLESGSSVLARIFDLCEMSGNRVDVDPMGQVTLARYVSPASKAASLTIDLSDPRGIAHDDLTLTTDWHEMVSVAAVTYRYTEQVKVTDSSKKQGYRTDSVQKEINGWANVSAKAHMSQSIRGWTKTKFETVSEMKPATKAQADKLAKELLNRNSKELVEWQLTTTYLPIWEGDVVNLVVPDGMAAYRGTRKCLVKAVELDLGSMDMRLTLKETASGDDE